MRFLGQSAARLSEALTPESAGICLLVSWAATLCVDCRLLIEKASNGNNPPQWWAYCHRVLSQSELQKNKADAGWDIKTEHLLPGAQYTEKEQNLE